MVEKLATPVLFGPPRGISRIVRYDGVSAWNLLQNGFDLLDLNVVFDCSDAWWAGAGVGVIA